jgi:hypothetical protein
MKVIRVPKTPKSAFNKKRPASDLLQAQIEHLEAVVFPAANPGAPAIARPIRPPVKTEGEAAAYIHSLTQQLFAKAVSEGRLLPSAPVLADVSKRRQPPRKKAIGVPSRKRPGKKRSNSRPAAAKRSAKARSVKRTPRRKAR